MRPLSRKSFMGRAAGGVLLVLLLVGGWFVLDRIMAGRTDHGGTGQPPAAPVVAQMDYDWSVLDLDGGEFPLGETQGKTLFLNFWATWCPPCVAEMPSIQRLYDELKDEGVAFVLVSDQRPATVRRFAQARGFTLPFYTSESDPPEVFRTRGIPATFIASPDGSIVVRHVGAGRWDDEKVVEFIRGLAADEGAP